MVKWCGREKCFPTQHESKTPPSPVTAPVRGQRTVCSRVPWSNLLRQHQIFLLRAAPRVRCSGPGSLLTAQHRAVEVCMKCGKIGLGALLLMQNDPLGMRQLKCSYDWLAAERFSYFCLSLLLPDRSSQAKSSAASVQLLGRWGLERGFKPLCPTGAAT